MTKPWLQPFGKWMVALKGRGRPGSLLRMVAKTLRLIILLECNLPPPYKSTDRIYGATDAGADDSKAAVGGWFSDKQNPDKAEVWWFMEEATQKEHPWAFSRGSPQRRNSSLELYGTIILVKLILKLRNNRPCTIPIFTDNQAAVMECTTLLSAVTAPSPTVWRLLARPSLSLSSH
jgi:hypothetical protein